MIKLLISKEEDTDGVEIQHVGDSRCYSNLPLGKRKFLKVRAEGCESIDSNIYDYLNNHIGEYIQIYKGNGTSTIRSKIVDVKDNIVYIRHLSRVPAPIYTLGGPPDTKYHWSEPVVFYETTYEDKTRIVDKIIYPDGDIVEFDKELEQIDMSKCKKYIRYDVVFIRNGEVVDELPCFITDFIVDENGIGVVNFEKCQNDVKLKEIDTIYEKLKEEGKL